MVVPEQLLVVTVLILKSRRYVVRCLLTQSGILMLNPIPASVESRSHRTVTLHSQAYLALPFVRVSYNS